MGSLLRKIGEQRNFRSRQLAERTDRQITEANWAEADAFQTHDFVIHSRQQSANLSVLPFVQHDVEIGAITHGFLHTDTFDGEPPFVEVHAALQRGERVR